MYLIRGLNQFKSLGVLAIHKPKPPAAVLGKPSRMEPDYMGEGRHWAEQTPGTHLLFGWRVTIACNLNLALGDPCKDHPVTLTRGPCQSCPSLVVPRPLIQILGVLRGWSVTVGGCPLAERRATIHPPGSCNPKGEGTKSRGTMQLAASGVGMGVSGTQPRLYAR